VDKRLLTSQNRSIGAGFNKLHNEKAKLKPLKINDLRMHVF